MIAKSFAPESQLRPRKVSVDHWRAGLRARTSLLIYAFWHVSVDHWRAGLRAAAHVAAGSFRVECQSITGALACAPAMGGSRKITASQVSVDHWRAGLRAAAQQGRRVIFFACQSITGALACAPKAT